MPGGDCLAKSSFRFYAAPAFKTRAMEFFPREANYRRNFYGEEINVGGTRH
jgi:hypothetical protein